ncbi:MAG: hypothetical protein PHU71_01240 [Candidatus Gracilibacteria bacterium]|nr:hypothetical protein [Candidatus Gracilibacteria bacterium]
MRHQYFQIIWKVKTQIILIILLTVLLIAPHYGLIPPPQELSAKLTSYFAIYGIPLVLIVSFFENLVGFNAYFPGSVVMLTAMAMTAGDPQRALAVYFAIIVPSLMAQHLNFLIGRYSNHEQSSSKVSNKQLFWWFLTTFWHPQLSSLTSLAAGSEGLPYKRYAKQVFTVGLAWTIFWAFVMYFFGQIAGATNNLLIPFYIYLNLWLVWDIWKYGKE